jgi:transposase
MPKPYSYDLRQKVMQAIELGGMSQLQASTTFQISRITINVWCQRKVLTGDYQAKPNLPPGNGHKITEWEKFKEFAKVNGDKTQVEMAKLWIGEISDREARHQGGRTISKALKKVGLTRKKKLMDTEKDLKRKDKNLDKN